MNLILSPKYDPIAIITPCSRKEHLQEIYEELEKQSHQSKQLIWWSLLLDSDFFSSEEQLMYEQLFRGSCNFCPVVHRPRKPSGTVLGTHLKNFVLAKYGTVGSWWYILDDDNQLYPGFLQRMSALISFGTSKVYTFDQKMADGIRTGNRIEVNHIDQAQYLVHSTAVGNIRYRNEFTCDGTFIVDIVEKHPSEYIPETLCYYNFFRGLRP